MSLIMSDLEENESILFDSLCGRTARHKRLKESNKLFNTEILPQAKFTPQTNTFLLSYKHPANLYFKAPKMPSKTPLPQKTLKF